MRRNLVILCLALVFLFSFIIPTYARPCSDNTLCTPIGYTQAVFQPVPHIAATHSRAASKVTARFVLTPVLLHAPPSGAVQNMIAQVFGLYAASALTVAKCESGYNPNAYNPTPVGNSHAEGVFQILYPSTWNSTSYAASSPYNAQANILAAHQIFTRDGNNWHEWACAA